MSVFDNGYGRFNTSVSEDMSAPEGISGYEFLDSKYAEKEKSIDQLQLEAVQAIANLKAPVEFRQGEVESLLASIHELADEGPTGAVESILKPVFLGLADGTVRAFKVPKKMGLTPSRIYKECESFSYKKTTSGVSTPVDSFTEALAAKEDANTLGAQQSYKGGIFTDKHGDSVNIRGQASYKNYGKECFGDGDVAPDEYDPNSEVKRAVKSEKGEQMDPDQAARDHIVPCSEICNTLKKNKALTRQDIADIANHEDNLALTKNSTNNAKDDDSVKDNIKKHGEELSDAQKETMLAKDKQARKTIVKEVNKKAIDNIKHNKDVQKDLASGAAKNAAAQASGNIVLYILKPFYYEMKDSVINGLEKGVNAGSIKSALTTRFSRMKEYIISNAGKTMSGETLNFLKGFVNMLMEAIISCLLGVVKMIFRLLKEGIKILGDSIKILRDENASVAQKGDAILKLVAASLSAFIGIWLEGYIGNVIPEPWSILLASMVSAGVMSGLLYIMNKVDLFSENAEIRHQRVMEILNGMSEETAQEADEILERMNLSVDRLKA